VQDAGKKQIRDFKGYFDTVSYDEKCPKFWRKKKIAPVGLGYGGESIHAPNKSAKEFCVRACALTSEVLTLALRFSLSR